MNSVEQTINEYRARLRRLEYLREKIDAQERVINSIGITYDEHISGGKKTPITERIAILADLQDDAYDEERELIEVSNKIVRISRQLGTINVNYQKVIDYSILGSQSQNQIARLMGITQARVSQLLKEALEKAEGLI